MQLEYQVQNSPRARWVRITVSRDGKVWVTQPAGVSLRRVGEFVASKSAWIRRKLEYFANLDPGKPAWGHGYNFRQHQQVARELILQRLEYFNQYYNLDYRRVFIRNQKGRWGSCSARKNLSFNFKLMFLPEDLRDYVIVHELCHLQELNHSAKFWDLVQQQIPNYRHLRQELKKYQ